MKKIILLTLYFTKAFFACPRLSSHMLRSTTRATNDHWSLANPRANGHCPTRGTSANPQRRCARRPSRSWG